MNIEIQAGDLWLIYGLPVLILSFEYEVQVNIPEKRRYKYYNGLSLYNNQKYLYSHEDFLWGAELISRISSDGDNQ
jgi:hypothetical protein